MKKIIRYILVLLPFWGFSQVQNGVFSTVPTTFTENEEITITVSEINLSTWGVSDVYLWAWYKDGNGNEGDSPTNGTWSNSNETQKMMDNGDGTYSYTMTPTTFYNTTGIAQIGILVKAKDGSGDKKTQDHLIDVGGYQLVLTSPTQNTTILDTGTNFTISATTSLPSSFVLKANGSTIDDSVGSATDYSYVYTVNATTNFELEASNGSETLTESFTLAVTPTVVEESLPNGLLDGINMDSNDPTKATLVLYAPMKAFVHVIGDFNNWQINDAYLMKKDASKDRFWIELSGLTPQYNHLYQYLVEYDIAVADPYSTLILDGYGNDQYIDNTTFPNIPTYPNGQHHAITVLRTGDSTYDWQVTNFQKPDKEDLVIYELLIRDFDELHSFNAVKNRLDYLEGLGVNAIELMPINEFDGNESWGYNPAFHMALDKYYGTKNALKSLIDECHARGIAVIVDVVYNHASGQHPYYRLWNTDNGGTAGQASADNPFFNQTATHSYSVFNDFNHQQQATKDYVNRTVTYWIEEFNIDGMRWDLTKGFTQNCSSSDENCTNSTQNDRIAVLQGYADNQWASDPNFYVIFEHLGGIAEEEQWANYRIDEGKGILLWNKMTDPYNEATMGYHDSGKSNFSNAAYTVKGFEQPSAVSYMESHDEERLMFKNLEFGNSEGSYSVKNLNTALERMQTAGAFFFTIPGPKMMWQFGELGYDISIEQNGRTGNKPILWSYTDEPERFAIYESWQDLITLKLEEPIFKTDDFSLDLNSTTGLKTIHLTDASATADELKYITIIGNFGLTSQEINPNFQETGTWYDLLNQNTPHEVGDVSATISIQPGEYRIYGNNPSEALIDPNDLDADGVVNANDLCPDTPYGSIVTVEGCAVFSLPSDNYLILSTGESCSSSDNGSISAMVKTLLDYQVAVTGPDNFMTTANFSTESWNLNNLKAGDYTLCFSVVGETGYEQCFDVSITEPEALSVHSKVSIDSKKVTLSLEGSSRYSITLNGNTLEIAKNSIELGLKQGHNNISVSGEKDCQGLFEQQIYVPTHVIANANPIWEDLELYLPTEQRETTVRVYTIGGQLVMTEKMTPNENGLASVSMATLKPGVYLVATENSTLKVVKK